MFPYNIKNWIVYLFNILFSTFEWNDEINLLSNQLFITHIGNNKEVYSIVF